MSTTINPEIAECLSNFHKNIYFLNTSTDLKQKFPEITDDKISLCIEHKDATFKHFYKEELIKFYSKISVILGPTDTQYLIYWMKKFNGEFENVKNSVKQLNLPLYKDYSDVVGTLSDASLYSTNETILPHNNNEYNKSGISPFVKSKMYPHLYDMFDNISKHTTATYNDNIKHITAGSSSMSAHGDNIVKDRLEINSFDVLYTTSILADVALTFGPLTNVISYFSSIANMSANNQFTDDDYVYITNKQIVQSLAGAEQKLTLLSQNVTAALDNITNLDFYTIE